MFTRLLPVFLITFVNWLGFSLFIPILPFIVKQYGYGSTMYGVLLAIYSIFQFFWAPLFGELSDHYGRKPILIRCQLGTLLSLCVFVYALTLDNMLVIWVSLPILVLFFARSIDGITWWNSSVANAYITDITKPEERSKIFGLTGAVIWLSLILWPAIGGRVALNRWYSEVLYVAIAISAIALLWLWYGLDESLESTDMKSWSINRLHEINIFKKFKILNNHRTLKPYFRLYGVFGFVFAAFTSSNVLYAIDILEFNEWNIWLLYFGIGLSLMFHQLVTVRRATSTYEDKDVFLVWLMVLGISLLPYFIEPWIVVFSILAFFVPAWLALALATFKGLITNEVDKKEYGTITWLDESLLAWNRAIAPILMGVAFGMIWWIAFGVLWVLLLFWMFVYTLYEKYK